MNDSIASQILPLGSGVFPLGRSVLVIDEIDLSVGLDSLLPSFGQWPQRITFFCPGRS